MIKGYSLEGEFRPTGGGMCEWTFCRDRDSAELFIKRFLKPKYPMPDAPGSSSGKQKLRERCEAFELRQFTLMKALKETSKSSGNLVAPVDFFRESSFYYKVSPKVSRTKLEISDLSRLNIDDKFIIMLTALHSLSVLHNLNLVHGDLKPDNILLKKTERAYAAKLIDFDDSYPSTNPPPSDLIVGDQVYFSPETEFYIREETADLGRKLTTQADIFSLGIVFYQYWTGKLPAFPRDRFRSVAAAVANGVNIAIPIEALPDPVGGIILRMLYGDPARRPNVLELIQDIKHLRKAYGTPASSSKEPASSERPEVLAGPILKGRGLRKFVEPSPAGELPAEGMLSHGETARDTRSVSSLTKSEGGSQLKGKVMRKLRPESN
jgi:serine/threonine protein kinase